ncbi:UDP-4-amino-4,6-dideoxy-N-acetyl-beta-L-altrosamine transaminase [Donghicola eburneus]|uniref:UDP-4-amino-4, 6-dideoxy-N-acetyl-beta-L-altrosamine transaminase n=1 Tax=Donghicola eburneus TaxID=393278 RepID=A0A1M4N366_9RHOB|nr:UDP-4-amino-4,6-dideoxy-N-acetyl-beta-L-altrosamine transaminase [Donghicola eburneus]SCM68458.1 UDP-4-amino-4, 6-dideoxy-N-acetyl-beta-L-altrosamine transaminase [Donghicola eburneus]SFQ24798.1 UDP-4-amino-4,6-dideoxy-N-acetyl-beta-L-altrosamine transaminase [Donghicola eburneus]
MIPYGRQDISQADIDAVVDVLKSDFLTQGPAVPAFEQAIADYVGAKFGVAVNSATSALHIAVKALGLGEGDLMWTSPITFVASANCGRYCGADVDFVDIDADTFNMCPDALAAKLEAAEAAGRLPKVIVPVHMCGQSTRAEEIAALARKYGIKIVEDASHAIGASYGEDKVGACAYSDITVFSFHPVKIITTAEGGLATTNDPVLAERMGLLRSHGVTRDPALMTHESDGPWYYQQVDLGWNYRMTEMQAALGLSQMARLDQFIDRRNALADRYDSLLADLPLQIPGRTDGARSAWHLYVIRLDDAAKHREVFEYLRANGIGVNLHYIPVHTQPYYRDLGHKVGDFPASEEYYSRAISIPLFAGMSDVEQNDVVRVLSEALSK